MLNEFVSYINNLCKLNKQVAFSEERETFLRFDFDELKKKIKNIKAFPAVILEGSSVSYKKNGSELLLKPRETALIFCQRVDDMERSDMVQQVYDELEDLADQFFVKIDADTRAKKYKALTTFDINSVSGHRMSDDPNRILMIRYFFPLTGRISNDINPEHWNND